jgi:hypothetical protein
MIDKGIILCNDIFEKIGIEYKKNIFWELSLNNRKAKEFWIKKYCFDQLFIKYCKRYDGFIQNKDNRHTTNEGNHYSNYVSPEVYLNHKRIGENEKLNFIDLRYRLFNEIILLKNIPLRFKKRALKDKQHYIEVEEFIECISCGYLDILYRDYKFNCFNGPRCIHCNRITNYTNEFMDICEMDQLI